MLWRFRQFAVGMFHTMMKGRSCRIGPTTGSGLLTKTLRLVGFGDREVPQNGDMSRSRSRSRRRSR